MFLNTASVVTCVRRLHSHTSVCQMKQSCASILHGHATNEKKTFLVQNYQRVLFQMVRRHSRKCHNSAVFISNADQTRCKVVTLDLDLENKLRDTAKLEADVMQRGLNLNISELYSKYLYLQELENKKGCLTEERRSTVERMKSFRNNENAESNQLKSQINDLRKEYQKVQREYLEVEEEMMVNGLKLPVDLHPSTPEDSVTVKEFGTVAVLPFKPKSHVDIAKRTNCVIFSDTSPGAYYLTHELACLSHRLLTAVGSMLQHKGLTPIVCPDMVKALVVEGCGYEFDNPQHVFTLEITDSLEKTDTLMHLTGVSAMGLIAYVSKMHISTNILPLQLFSSGTSYSAEALHRDVGEYPSLLRSPQASVVEILGCASDHSEMEDLYHNYVTVMEEFYEWLNLPIRLVRLGANDLKAMESARIEAQIWMPSLEKFTKVGWVSCWGDYASRRLMIKSIQDHRDLTTRDYILTVHGTILHMPTLLAALLENAQTESGSYEVPEHLLKVMQTGKLPY